jgi:RNA polymerase sigma-70 factor (ECF subfamily)
MRFLARLLAARPGCSLPGELMSAEDDNVRFRDVVMPHLGDAFTLARWISGNRTDAEDILQEACLRAFRGVSGFAGGSPRAWLLTIVRRTAYTWLMKNRPPMLVSVDDLNASERSEVELKDVESSAKVLTPETELVAKADAEQLKGAIGCLPLNLRETLVLRDIQGLDYREIANITGTPIGTVMSRLARARRRLVAAMSTQQQ